MDCAEIHQFNGKVQRARSTFKHIVVTVQLLLAQSADQWEHLNQQQAALRRTDWLHWGGQTGYTEKDRLVTLVMTHLLHWGGQAG